MVPGKDAIMDYMIHLKLLFVYWKEKEIYPAG